MRAFLICMLGLFCVSHLFAKWFADFPAVLCFAIAMPRHPIGAATFAGCLRRGSAWTSAGGSFTRISRRRILPTCGELPAAMMKEIRRGR